MQISWACWERSYLVWSASITSNPLVLLNKQVACLNWSQFFSTIYFKFLFPHTPFPFIWCHSIAVEHFPVFSMVEFANDSQAVKRSAVLTEKFYALGQHRLGLLLLFEELLKQRTCLVNLWGGCFLGFWGLLLNPSPLILTSSCPKYRGICSVCINTVAISKCKHYETIKGYQMESL